MGQTRTIADYDQSTLYVHIFRVLEIIKKQIFLTHKKIIELQKTHRLHFVGGELRRPALSREPVACTSGCHPQVGPVAAAAP